MITAHTVSANGTVYLRTQYGRDAAEIAEALRPYVGRFAAFYPPNVYGYINTDRATRGWIRAVDGTQVTVYVPSTGFTGAVDAFAAFGSYCTLIEAEQEVEGN